MLLQEDSDFDEFDYATESFRVREVRPGFKEWLTEQVLKKKGVLVSLFTLVGLIFFFAAAFIPEQPSELGSSSGLDNQLLGNISGRARYNFDAVSAGALYASQSPMVWASGGEDGSYIEKDGNNYILLRKVQDTSSRITLLNPNDAKRSDGSRLYFSDFYVSKSLKKILLLSDYEKGWRHSFYGNYWIYDTESKQTRPLSTSVSNNTKQDEMGSGKVSLALWSPVGSHIAWVRDNDLYVTLNSTIEKQITADGSKDVINGISDWVYEEEVLASHSAMWFSPDDRFLAFLKFNDTLVMEYPLEFYERGDNRQYPETLNVKYPKPGTPNPIVSLFITSLYGNYSTAIITFPKAFDPSDMIISEVFWLSKDTLFVRIMNRVQDIQLVYLVKASIQNGIVQWTAKLTRNESNADKAWFDKTQAAKPLLLDGSDGYIELKETDRGFVHLAYYKTADSTPEWLTSGDWEVDKLVSIDPQRLIAYYISTQISSVQRHFYSVNIKTKESILLSNSSMIPDRIPPMVNISSFSDIQMINSTTFGYYDASMSAGNGYLNIVYKGPGVPVSVLYKVGKDDPIGAIETFDGVAKQLQQYALPFTGFGTILNKNRDEMNVKVLFPPDFNRTRKYPLFVKTYGGPSSQLVQMRYGFDFLYALADAGFIVAIVDGRGTGFKGRSYRTCVYKNLGKLEVDDLNAAADFMTKLAYIDSSRVAIWGWSYGGYLASKVMESENSPFTLGIAVAPVTNWMFYDSIYSERYMRLPINNAEGYATSAVRKMEEFKKKDFLLLHGTSDGEFLLILDNVHYQNTADLVWHLTNAGVNAFRMRVFTDSDHNINAGNANKELFQLLKSFLFEKFNLK